MAKTAKENNIAITPFVQALPAGETNYLAKRSL